MLPIYYLHPRDRATSDAAINIVGLAPHVLAASNLPCRQLSSNRRFDGFRLGGSHFVGVVVKAAGQFARACQEGQEGGQAGTKEVKCSGGERLTDQ